MKDRVPVFAIECPHCGARSKTRSSIQQSKLCREIRFNCSNIECGHTFVGQLAILRTVLPSRRPDPAINLPMSLIAASRHGKAGAANDDHRPPANDAEPIGISAPG